MPRGEHPNSLANLEHGKETQFKPGVGMSAEQREKAARTKKENRRFAEIFENVLNKKYNVKTPDGKKRITGKEALAQSMFQKAFNGDVKAFLAIRDTIGEAPVEKIMSADVDPAVMAEVERLVNGEESNGDGDCEETGD